MIKRNWILVTLKLFCLFCLSPCVIKESKCLLVHIWPTSSFNWLWNVLSERDGGVCYFMSSSSPDPPHCGKFRSTVQVVGDFFLVAKSSSCSTVWHLEACSLHSFSISGPASHGQNDVCFRSMMNLAGIWDVIPFSATTFQEQSNRYRESKKGEGGTQPPL